ncbi:MAG: glycoside hydrolase family 2 TIM barrel-domain containing protein [Kiritimatiellae bacterium]|nr:glycoside hydrolase family 2 TIM barrel-domain containing protein [Kiritimatiellia bacterium]MDD5522910.1 glycoside hydrolase family 2 TIM barrel-domain containing protein [Kiritimatiellia bacterium]
MKRDSMSYCGILVMVAWAMFVNVRAAELIPSQTVTLDGPDWRIATDSDNKGRDQKWFEKPEDGAKMTRSPSIIQETFPGYHGVAWYWREFTPPTVPHPQGRYLLRFWAVDYLAEVWLNGAHVGGHEGGETPFVLDVTDTIRAGTKNLLAVRVLNPKAEAIDGIVLAETPHRNKAPAGIKAGASYNSGGITESVEVFWVPVVRLDDVYVRPDWRTGRVKVQATVMNAGKSSTHAQFHFAIASALGNETVATLTAEQDVPPGSKLVECELTVADHRLWQLDDPYLYRLTTRLITIPNEDAHENITRFGFRELRVEKGYFRLNGKRIFLKSAHTGNHCPVGAILPPASVPDLLRKDLLYMKSCGFNMVRFIAGIAHPYQLDLCDEIGLMVYEENLASWLLADSPKMAERFDVNLREMVLRDRNHPSIVIFGLVNEMRNGPMVRHAVGSLALLRSLDDSRLILQQSGRWDGQYNIGSVCNPGSMQWEYMWGIENADYQGTAKGGPFGGYFQGAGDAHVYPAVPHTPEIEAGIRNLGSDSKPVFLSEYGIGSLMNAIRELRYYEQYGANPEWDDFKFLQQTEEKLAADWKRFGMEGVYAFPEEMLRASQQLHCRQRLLGFNLIRSNPKICGFNLTGLLDHGYTGEGLWTFWREFKPGIMEALQDGWAPLRWCLFAAPMHAYVGRPLKLEAILANEDVLAPGTYKALLRVVGPNGIAWAEKRDIVIPQPAAGDDGPFAVPVFSGDVTLSGPAGQYLFAATMEHGGAPAGGRLTFHLSELPTIAPVAVVVSQVDVRVQEWLKTRGLTVTPLESKQVVARQVILVGDWNDANVQPKIRKDLLQRVARGSVAVFLKPGAFKKGSDIVGWLPLKNKGRLTSFHDWLYHKECVAKKHPFFNGLQPAGIMDWDYYGPLITRQFFEGQDTAEDIAATAFVICHNSRPDGYAAGTMLGVYRFGSGKIILNTFNILDNVDKHPAADRLLMNMINYAAQEIDKPLANLPTDFDKQLKAIGYE